MPNRVVLVHGYSDSGRSFRAWHDALAQRGYDVARLSTCSYATLTNEVTIKDIAEGFDRALREHAELGRGEPFDAIVHSTGMLVLRAWLTRYGNADRVSRLKHLIGLAPATWGSPLAHKGRSFIGALFKGNKNLLDPDFMEAGDRVLDGLELASRFTWDLAHQDLFHPDRTFYGFTGDTPWPFVFCGNQGYEGLRALVNDEGTDGTVRWAGCALDSRRFELDLTGTAAGVARVTAAVPARLDCPVVMVAGRDHGSILKDPPADLVDRVVLALKVSTAEQYRAWQQEAHAWSAAARRATGRFQQFIVRVVDERDDPVPDYNLQLLQPDGTRIRAFDASVHRYAGDPSLRAFHVDHGALEPAGHEGGFKVRLMASSGSSRVGYAGVGSDKLGLTGEHRGGGTWDATFDLAAVQNSVKLFHPLTTTLVQIRINREPLPLSGRNDVLWWH
jgi:hypothetical protein